MFRDDIMFSCLLEIQCTAVVYAAYDAMQCYNFWFIDTIMFSCLVHIQCKVVVGTCLFKMRSHFLLSHWKRCNTYHLNLIFYLVITYNFQYSQNSEPLHTWWCKGGSIHVHPDVTPINNNTHIVYNTNITEISWKIKCLLLSQVW